MLGTRGVPHSEVCRTRLTEKIAQSEEGRARTEAAEQRQHEFFARVIEKADRKRKPAEQEPGDQEIAGAERDREDRIRGEPGAERNREEEDREELDEPTKRRNVEDEDLNGDDTDRRDREVGIHAGRVRG